MSGETFGSGKEWPGKDQLRKCEERVCMGKV